MLLVAGLGNPGREHARNRHNAGWMVVDELARRHGGSWRGKFAGQMAEVRVGDERLALLKPETYMNDSGRSVGPAAAFFKLEPSEVLVVHDEGDFDLGRLELKVGGGLAGHNGLRSIAQQLGTPDFLRLRIGVGRPERGDPRPLADWVLANFEPHERCRMSSSRARRMRSSYSSATASNGRSFRSTAASRARAAPHGLFRAAGRGLRRPAAGARAVVAAPLPSADRSPGGRTAALSVPPV